MTQLVGRNHRREVFMQWLRERLGYKPSVYKQMYDPARAVFIHIPKNAGTTVAMSLYGKGAWHWTASDLIRINRKKYLSYFKFAVVRNPWDRLYSAYRYARKDVQTFKSSPLEFITRFPDFETFVMEGVTKDIARRHYFIGLQINYLVLPSGQVDPHINVGKLENLQSYLSQIRDSLPILLDIGHKNASPVAQPLHIAYTSEMADRVEKLYAPDIKTFDYKFPSALHQM